MLRFTDNVFTNTHRNMAPLTHDEAALLYHVQMFGSQGYPIQKRGRQWWIGDFRSWKGFPVPYKTKRAAEEQFERWMDLARDRWREMKKLNPALIMTAVGIRGNTTSLEQL